MSGERVGSAGRCGRAVNRNLSQWRYEPVTMREQHSFIVIVAGGLLGAIANITLSSVLLGAIYEPITVVGLVLGMAPGVWHFLSGLG